MTFGALGVGLSAYLPLKLSAEVAALLLCSVRLICRHRCVHSR
jgi:hypothetical protein